MFPGFFSPTPLIAVDWQTVAIHPDDSTVFTIGDLLPDAIYEFSVQSQTSSGDALFSKVLRVRTKALDDFVQSADGREFFLAQKKSYHHHRREGGGIGTGATATVIGVVHEAFNHKKTGKSTSTSSSSAGVGDRMEVEGFEIDADLLPPLRRG